MMVSRVCGFVSWTSDFIALTHWMEFLVFPPIVRLCLLRICWIWSVVGSCEARLPWYSSMGVIFLRWLLILTYRVASKVRPVE